MYLTKRFSYYLRPKKDQLKKLNEILIDLQLVHRFTIEYARNLFIAHGEKTVPEFNSVFLALYREHEHLFWIDNNIIGDTIKSAINDVSSFRGEAHELDYLIKTLGQFNFFNVPQKAIWRLYIEDRKVYFEGVGSIQANHTKKPFQGKIKKATFVKLNEKAWKLFVLCQLAVEH